MNFKNMQHGGNMYNCPQVANLGSTNLWECPVGTINSWFGQSKAPTCDLGCPRGPPLTPLFDPSNTPHAKNMG